MEKRKIIRKLKSAKNKLLKLSNTPKNALIVTSIYMEIENYLKSYKDCDEKKQCLHVLKLTYEKEMFNFFKQVKSHKKMDHVIFNEYESSVRHDITSCLRIFNEPLE